MTPLVGYGVEVVGDALGFKEHPFAVHGRVGGRIEMFDTNNHM